MLTAPRQALRLTTARPRANYQHLVTISCRASSLQQKKEQPRIGAAAVLAPGHPRLTEDSRQGSPGWGGGGRGADPEWGTFTGREMELWHNQPQSWKEAPLCPAVFISRPGAPFAHAHKAQCECCR